MATGDSRIVAGKWRMGETLGKGGYSWVKKGTNIANPEEIVALKFTHKPEQRWDKKDEETIQTEIAALTRMSKKDHPNIMKIHEWNLSCPYPTKTGSPIETILFVLEYATGGELFDILFYTGKLAQDEARTYMHQLINGLEALHKEGICHRDIKPQNLLLNSDFELKITDFGLSKIMESEADTTMRTTHVGTRGYQSPEQLLNQPYTVATDLFAAGVVLFVLTAGYPPFEHANKQDYWYKNLIARPGKPANHAKFWKAHRQAGVPEDCQDFLNNVLASDPHKRFTIDQIREHKWFNGPKLNPEELKARLTKRVAEVHAGRLTDAEKMLEQQDSIKMRGTKPRDPERIAPDYRNAGRTLCQFRTKAHPDEILDAISHFIANPKQPIGHADVDTDKYSVKALVATKNQKLEFEASVFNDKEAEENVVNIKRLQGGFVEYGKFYNMLLNKCLYPLEAEVGAES